MNDNYNKPPPKQNRGLCFITYQDSSPLGFRLCTQFTVTFSLIKCSYLTNSILRFLYCANAICLYHNYPVTESSKFVYLFLLYCCCYLPSPLTLVCGGSPIIPLIPPSGQQLHHSSGSVHKSMGDNVVQLKRWCVMCVGVTGGA